MGIAFDLPTAMLPALMTVGLLIYWAWYYWYI